MKILVTGGMGYIASAVVELLREQRDIELLLLDRVFRPERVANLPPQARFVEGDAGDVSLMRRLLEGVDVLMLLNAEVEAESSGAREALVWEANFEVPKRLIEATPNSTRILFASSGNVFGGASPEGKFLGLEETDEPSPRLPYAETKRAVEKLLLGSDKNFTVLRFGTNYGFAPGVRFNLVTNIFTMKALRGEALTVHGRGDNHRPTCCVKDCARALHFLSTKSAARGEIFHVVSATYRIRELAEKIVDVCGAGATVQYVDKVVPFNSYGLSSAKVENLGFRFEWPLERAIEDMKVRFRAVIPPGLNA